MAQLCKVVITGRVLEGTDKGAAVRQLATLLKCPSQKAAQMLSGRPTPVGKPMQHQMAARYRSRLESIGVECDIQTAANESGRRVEDTKGVLPSLVEARRRDYYVRKFNRFDKRHGRFFPTLNILALFVPLLWFIYRGLPLPAILTGIAYASGNVFVIAAAHVMAAFTAEYLYFRRLARYRERYAMASAEMQKRILTRGGVSSRNVMIAGMVSWLLLTGFAVFTVLDVKGRLRDQELAKSEQQNRIQAEQRRQQQIRDNAPEQLQHLALHIKMRLGEEDAKRSGVGFPDTKAALIKGLQLDPARFKDVWNRDISYEKQHNAFVLKSPGEDGVTGTSDDLLQEQKVVLVNFRSKELPPHLRDRNRRRQSEDKSLPPGVFGGGEAAPAVREVPGPPSRQGAGTGNDKERELPPGVFSAPAQERELPPGVFGAPAEESELPPGVFGAPPPDSN